jgi:hypothetical protein
MASESSPLREPCSRTDESTGQMERAGLPESTETVERAAFEESIEAIERAVSRCPGEHRMR